MTPHVFLLCSRINIILVCTLYGNDDYRTFCFMSNTFSSFSLIFKYDQPNPVYRLNHLKLALKNIKSYELTAYHFCTSICCHCHYTTLGQQLGRTVGRVVKALDSQPRDRCFESLRTLSLQHLKSLGKICTRNVLRFTQP